MSLKLGVSDNTDMDTVVKQGVATQPDETCGVIQAAFRLNILYWVCMFFVDSVLGYFIKIDPIESAPLKLVLFGMSGVMTYGMARLLIHLRKRSFPQKALLCIGMTMLAAPVYTAIDFINYTICQYPKAVTFDPMYSGYTLIEGASILFGWNCLFVAVIDNFEIVDRERQLAAMREESLNAQMQALRYQINPHFLFNTLNSIAGLIEEGAATRAERMVLSLSTFMRTTLSMDPMSDVTLADEIALQQEYLEIERERFQDRMTFEIHVSEEAQRALMPSLILQPLIENAIKHGVGASTGHVNISLSARRESERLHILIENDMPGVHDLHKAPPGMGVGLKNVAERLRLRFQGNSQFSSGETPLGRYLAEIYLPWRTQ